MTSPRLRAPSPRAAGFGAAALALWVSACEARGPVHPAPGPVPAWTEGRSETPLPPQAAIEAAVRRNYPEVLNAGPEEQIKLRFFVDADGRIERHELVARALRPIMPEGFGFRVEPEFPRVPQTGPVSRVSDVFTFLPGQLGPGEVVVAWDRTLRPEERQGRWIRVGSMNTVPAEPFPGQAGAGTGAGGGRWQSVPGGFHWSEGDDDGARPPSTEAVLELVTRYMPGVRRGPVDFVWFVADANGQVVHFGDSRDTRELSARPAAGYAYIQGYFGREIVVNGESLPVIWAQLKR